MSMVLKTIVPHNPIAALPATPSVVRGAAQCAGRNAAAVPAARTTSVCAAARTAPAPSPRVAARKTTTAKAVSAPVFAPAIITVRKSERAVAAGAALVVMAGSLRGLEVRAGNVAGRRHRPLGLPDRDDRRGEDRSAH